MEYGPFHPKAYLSRRTNVRKGLSSRSKIILILEKGEKTIRQIETETNLTYSAILYHLNAMRRERIVDRTFLRKPLFWKLTGFGQQKLIES